MEGTGEVAKGWDEVTGGVLYIYGALLLLQIERNKGKPMVTKGNIKPAMHRALWCFFVDLFAAAAPPNAPSSTLWCCNLLQLAATKTAELLCPFGARLPNDDLKSPFFCPRPNEPSAPLTTHC